MKGILSLLALLVLVSQGRHPALSSVSICTDETLTATAYSAEAVSYQWFKDGLPLPGEVKENLKIMDPGLYEARCYTSKGCLSEASEAISVTRKQPFAANDEAYSTGSSVVIMVLANDTRPCSPLDPSTLVIEIDPLHGQVSMDVNGQLTYTPEAGYAGTDEFSYSIKDANGISSNIARVKVNVGSPLPVRLLSFQVEKDEADALVLWQTTLEEDIEKYEIQRSTDARNWVAIGEVEAKGGSGSEKVNYRYSDPVPENGMNYYRLKMIESDGSYHYSVIASLYFEMVDWVKIYPNPADKAFTILIRNKQIKELRLMDAYGRLILSTDVKSPLQKLDIQAYPVGVYFIRLRSETGRVYHFKVMKN